MSPLDYRIERLRDDAASIECLARWHHAEWGALMAPWSLAEARAELAAHARNTAWPCTFVALRHGAANATPELVGSVSLLDVDEPRFADLGPWLASLYVRPACRGQGLGRALIQHLEQAAAAMGIARLYLFTPEHADYYAQLGWSSHSTRMLNAQRVAVLWRELARPSAEPPND